MVENVVTPRASPDLDGLACALAYAELLQRRGLPARAWIAGTPDPEASYAAERTAIKVDSSPAPEGSRVVLVDASDLRGLPAQLNALQVVEVIDHRIHHRAAELFPNATICIEPVGAAATLVTERFQAAGCIPSSVSAELLQAAIISNTQALRGSVTTDRDRAAILALRSVHELPDDFIEAQFHARRQAILDDLEGAIRREQKEFDHPDGPYVLSQLEFLGARRFIDACLPCVAALAPRTMLNLVDVEAADSWLLVPDPGCRAWVERRTALRFRGPVAKAEGVLLRKQIVARLEEGI